MGKYMKAPCYTGKNKIFKLSHCFSYLSQNCTGYTDEGVETNIGGAEIGHNKKCEHYGQIEAGGSAGVCEETAAELEADVSEDEQQQSDEESA